jgi:DNA topoisomerase-1
MNLKSHPPNESLRSFFKLNGYALVIAEKPDAAQKLAVALGWKKGGSRSGIFEIPAGFDGRSYVICSALGHLFQIGDPQRERSIFPVFDLGWYPKESKRQMYFTRPARSSSWVDKRIEMFSHLSRNASIIVNACDYDIEGETIGSNILKFACQPGLASYRARFSTLTEEEIRSAFTNLLHDSGRLASAGRMRHSADFLWGVNLSRALTALASENRKKYSQVAIGRVQGPTLAFLVDREIEIASHVPIPRWNILCTVRTEDTTFEARHNQSPFDNLPRAERVFERVAKSKSGKVASLEKERINTPPRYPFDLGSLQREAFYIFRKSPSETLRIAEKLYLKGLISYPRTDSQKLPASIGPQNVLNKIAHNPEYSRLVNQLLEEPHRTFPWQGPKQDQAHPSIFPTGVTPSSLSSEEKRIYDLIVRRFCNTFAGDAISEKTRATIDVSGEEFLSEWEVLMAQGWMKYYPFRKIAHTDLQVRLEVGDDVAIENIRYETKYSSPPTRYNEASLIGKMESEGIGTKATRAETLSTLIGRRIIRNTRESLVPGENALNLIGMLRSNCPEIVSPGMTRSLEAKIAKVEEGQDKESLLIEELENLRRVISKLARAELPVWNLKESETKKSQNEIKLGPCPNCTNGNLVALRSARTHKRYIRCTNYGKECSMSSPLPPRGKLLPSHLHCETCGWPILTIIYRQKGSTKSCCNYFCSSRMKEKN